jgi:cobalt/nickel transport system permease protein
LHPEIDRFAHLDSPLHRLDPRIKLAGFTGFLIGVAMVHGLLGAALSLGMAMLWLLISRIPLGFTLRRLKPVALFLTPFLALLPLTHPGGWQAGLLRGGVIYLKGLAMVLTVVAMFGTTPFNLSMKALVRLKVPQRLVTMILFAYRYLFVFGEEMRTLQQALKARGFKAGANGRTWRSLGQLVGLLVVRAFERTERIYQAMLARGFKDRFGALTEFAWSWGDALKGGVIVLAAAALVGVDYLWTL